MEVRGVVVCVSVDRRRTTSMNDDEEEEEYLLNANGTTPECATTTVGTIASTAI